MKAPDKIYIDIATFGFIHGYNAEAHPPACQEFISKDALLEKLRKAAESYKKRSDEGELVWQNMCGINEAIDILNKM